MGRLRPALLCVLVFVVAICDAADVAGDDKTRRGRPPTLAMATETAISATLDKLQADGDFEAAGMEMDAIFDCVIAYAKDSDKKSFINAAFARRLVAQLAEVDEAARMDLLSYLRENDYLARCITFLVKPAGKETTAGSDTAVIDIREGKFIFSIGTI